MSSVKIALARAALLAGLLPIGCAHPDAIVLEPMDPADVRPWDGVDVPEAEARARAELFSLVPPEANVVTFYDLARLRAYPRYEQLLSGYDDTPLFTEAALSGCGIADEDLRYVLIVSLGSGFPPAIELVSGPDLAREDVGICLAKALAVEGTWVGGHGSDILIAVDGSIPHWKRAEPYERTHAGLSSMPPGAALFSYGRPTGTMRVSWLGKVREMTLALDTTNGLTAYFHAEVNDDDSPKRLLRYFQRSFKRHRAAVNPLGASATNDVFDRIEGGSDSDSVYLRFYLTPKRTAGAAQRPRDCRGCAPRQ